MSKKNIKIAFDPGFSGGKIIINSLVLNVPFVIIHQNKVTDGNYSLRRVDNNYLACEYEGEKYTLGTAAQEYLLRSKKNEKTDSVVEGLFTMSRFHTTEFQIMLKSLIGYALCKYEEYTQLTKQSVPFSLQEVDDWNIYVGISLPHSYVEEYRQIMKNYLLGNDPQNPIRHNISLTIGDTTREISYKLQPKVVCNSQLINAIINELLDETGTKEIDDICGTENRPTLVIDGGYKTVGIGLVEKDMSVANATSNTDIAMMNINSRVCDKISEHTSGYHDYMIDRMAADGEVIRYLDDSGQVREMDVAELKEKETALVANELIQELLLSFDNLLSIKSILLAGGTGQVFQDYLCRFCKEERAFLAEKIHIGTQNQNNPFHGIIEKDNTYISTIITDPVYTVSLGLYKEMCAKID